MFLRVQKSSCIIIFLYAVVLVRLHRQGYGFVCWKLADSGEIVGIVSLQNAQNGTVRIMAVWRRLKFRISFDSDGGFPYALKLGSLDDKRAYVRSLVDEIYEKDVARRIRIRNRAIFEQARRYVIDNFGSPVSIQNIADDLVRSGVAIKHETVQKYIHTLADTKILMPCERFDMKSRESLNGERKYYLSDLSFYYALNTDNRINFGPVLENIAYVYARSKGCSISVGNIGRLECDFITRDNGGFFQNSFLHAVRISVQAASPADSPFETGICTKY